MNHKLVGLLIAALFITAAVVPSVVGRKAAEPASPLPKNDIKLLRVVVPGHSRSTLKLMPFGPGLEAELIRAFCRREGYLLKQVYAASPEDAWALLQRNEADLFIGLGSDVPESLGLSVASGPAYAHYRPVIVRSKQRKPRGPESLEDAPLPTANPALEGRLAAAFGTETARSNESYSIEPVLNSLSRDETHFALADEGRFRMWQPFFPKVRPAAALTETIPYRWFWNEAKPELTEAMNDFWQAESTYKTLKELTEKYFGFLPRETDYYELWHLSRTLNNSFVQYREAIDHESRANRIDPLLVTAIIYQESRFDPQARSKTGVRGLMQLTTNTARLLNIQNRRDPVQSIQGGTKYLRQIYDKLGRLGLEPWERWNFTLAAYNRGLGHVLDAVDLAKKMGGTGRTWAELKKTLPLLAYEKYYKQSRYGYTRGYEAVAYVDRIRYYYYILNGLVILERPEAKNLLPLLGAIPRDWPAVS